MGYLQSGLPDSRQARYGGAAARRLEQASKIARKLVVLWRNSLFRKEGAFYAVPVGSRDRQP